MKPGATTRPFASITRVARLAAAVAAAASSTSVTLPPATATAPSRAGDAGAVDDPGVGHQQVDRRRWRTRGPAGDGADREQGGGEDSQRTRERHEDLPG